MTKKETMKSIPICLKEFKLAKKDTFEVGEVMKVGKENNGDKSKCSDEGIKTKYMDSLEEIVIDKKGDPKRELTNEEFKKLRKATGKLSWLAETSRSDLAYNVLEMSNKNKNVNVEDVKEMNKIIRKAKQEPSEVLFSRIADTGYF